MSPTMIVPINLFEALAPGGVSDAHGEEKDGTDDIDQVRISRREDDDEGH